MRRALTIAALVTAALAISLPAVAHGDQRLIAESLTLEPGERVVVEGDVHYHRLVGRFTASGPVLVTIGDPMSDSIAFDRGPGTDLAVNELIRCCDGETWTAYHLTIENTGTDRVEVDARASLVHDDVAVSVFRAESGVVESMVVLGGVWAYALRRRRRKAITTSRRQATTATLALASAVVALGLYGTIRYGAGSVSGLLAGLADVPIIPMNPLVSRASMLLGLVMIGWAVTGARWAASRHDADLGAWLIHGSIVAGMVVVAAVAVSGEYGTIAMPMLIGALALTPIGVVLWLDGRSRSSDSGVPQTGV